MRKWLATAVAVPALMAVSIPLLLVAEPTLAEQATACASPAAVPTGNFTAEQVAIARAAARVADRRKLPSRAKLVILATGFQESGIRNLTYGDRDSIGWLQQRPSQGWGTVAQIMDPAYGAGKFYDALVKVPAWQGMPVTVAAQAVQVSPATRTPTRSGRPRRAPYSPRWATPARRTAPPKRRATRRAAAPSRPRSTGRETRERSSRPSHGCGGTCRVGRRGSRCGTRASGT